MKVEVTQPGIKAFVVGDVVEVDTIPPSMINKVRVIEAKTERTAVTNPAKNAIKAKAE